MLLRLLAVGLGLFMTVNAVHAQSPAPAITFDSMLDTSFGNTDGRVSFGDNTVAFAPEGEFNGEAVIINTDNEILSRFAYFPDYQFRDGVFGRVRIQGPASATMNQPGTYFIVYLIDGQPVSRLPFVVRQTSAGDDPFNPEKTYAIDGYWRTFAYLTMDTFRDETMPRLHMWIGGVDLPEGSTGDMMFAQLLRDGEMVAHSKRTQGFIPTGHFRRETITLYHPHDEKSSPNAEGFLLSDWQVDGKYEVRITRKSDNQMIRSYDFTVTNGKIDPHPRSVLGFSPAHDYIVPRVQKRGGNNFEMLEAIWIEDR